MATIKKQLLGVPRGKVGDLLFKNRKGKSYLAPMPRKYKVTNCIDAINNRSRFGVASQFASAVNHSAYLKPLWNVKNLRGKSPYTKCLGYNYPFTKGLGTWRLSLITPHNINIDFSSVNLTKDSIDINFYIKKNSSEIFNNPFIAVTIIFFKDLLPSGSEQSMKNLLFVTLESEVLDFQPDYEDVNNYSYNIKKDSLWFIDFYKNIMAYTAFISPQSYNGKPLFTTGNAVPVRGFEYDHGSAGITEKDEPKQSEPFFNFRIK
ncbi:MAG: hypothetical protein WC644_08320 [Ignavibacteria bacterium]